MLARRAVASRLVLKQIFPHARGAVAAKREEAPLRHAQGRRFPDQCTTSILEPTLPYRRAAPLIGVEPRASGAASLPPSAPPFRNPGRSNFRLIPVCRLAREGHRTRGGRRKGEGARSPVADPCRRARAPAEPILRSAGHCRQVNLTVMPWRCCIGLRVSPRSEDARWTVTRRWSDAFRSQEGAPRAAAERRKHSVCRCRR